MASNGGRDSSLKSKVEKLAVSEKCETGSSVRVKVPKGTRDFTPSMIAVRDKLFNIVVSAFKQHGAEEIDTPAFELKETLTNKYGEDSKLIYDLADQGGELLSLRYDLTVPLARYVAMNKIDHIKRFHIAKVYRRDNPAMTRGRFREFYQCDFDICGRSDPIIPDVECCKVVCQILEKLNLGSFFFKLNHRKILDGYMQICGVPSDKIRAISSSIDKLDKTPWDAVYTEMVVEKKLDPLTANRIREFVQLNGGREVLETLRNKALEKSQTLVEGLSDLELFLDYAEKLKFDQYIKIDLSLARGLDYYTGCIFEFLMNFDDPQIAGSEEGSIGSVAGGGRYDNLIGMFSKKGRQIPAVGVSVGIERLMTLLERKLAASNERIRTTSTRVFVSSPDDRCFAYRLEVVQLLWQADIQAEISYKKKGMVLRDFQYCEDNGIPFCLILGENEQKSGCVNLRNIKTREETKVPLSDLVSQIQKLSSDCC